MSSKFVRIGIDLTGTDAINMDILIKKVTPLYNDKKTTALRTILTLIMADVPYSDKLAYRDKLRHESKKHKKTTSDFSPYGKRYNKPIQDKPKPTS
jgi:hypothetical protein